MNDLLSHYHFIGIGGIGMSGLAAMLLKKGYTVSGSDLKENKLTVQLQEDGATIFTCHDKAFIKPHMTIVYSTDIKASNVELIEAKKQSLKILHRSELLNQLMQEYTTLLVAGAHGKTTTSALLAWTLIAAGAQPSFAIGGVLQPLGVNSKLGEGEFFVAEADESDGSFLNLDATAAIITNVEDDHLNYWKTSEALNQGYIQFLNKIDKPKMLWICGDDPFLNQFKHQASTYGFSSHVDLQIRHFKQEGCQSTFDLIYKGETHSQVILNLLGCHNALNAAGVFGLCLELGCDPLLIREGLKTFSGTKRRLEYRGSVLGAELFDDYGHHPTEIQATLAAMKSAKPDQRLVLIFQPHRYTRLKDLWKEFTLSFKEADVCIIADLYSAGEPPIEGISSELLYEDMKGLYENLHHLKDAHLVEGVLALLKSQDVVITMGAGDITTLPTKLIEHSKHLQEMV